MDFSAVVSRAKQLLAPSGTSKDSIDSDGDLGGVGGRGKLTEVIYGRVCTTRGEEPPLLLSSDAERKGVFLFGPEAVESIIVRQSAYGILCSIGRDKDYLYHTVSINIHYGGGGGGGGGLGTRLM